VRERRVEQSAAPRTEERRTARVWETRELLFAEHRED